MDTHGALVVLTVDDIEAYSPSDRAIIVSRPAIVRMARDIGTPADMLDGDFGDGCFALAIGGRRLFGGQTKPIGTATIATIPTLYPDATGGGLRLSIRPSGGFLIPSDRVDPSLWSRVRSEDLRSYFAGAGRLASP